MNTHAKKQNNFFLFVFTGFFSCSSVNTVQVKSSIDANYKYNRKYQGYSNRISPGIWVYQSIIRKVLGSRCHFYPSDSTYALMRIKKCGGFNGWTHSLSRIIKEYNVYDLGYPIITLHHELYFEDFPETCD